MIPPKENAAFVWRMEEVLDLYEEPHDPDRPVVCFDERPCRLLSEVRESIPQRPGRDRHQDSEYQRRGTCHVLMAFEPLAGWRHVSVSKHRRECEFAEFMRYLAEEAYPQADTVRVVMDNLNTHKASAFYEFFEAARARRLARKLEFVYTPVHGSWLNMVEIELSVLVRQCLRRCLPDMETLGGEVGAWEAERNGSEAGVEWRFTTSEARVKLHRLYPSIDD